MQCAIILNVTSKQDSSQDTLNSINLQRNRIHPCLLLFSFHIFITFVFVVGLLRHIPCDDICRQNTDRRNFVISSVIHEVYMPFVQGCLATASLTQMYERHLRFSCMQNANNFIILLQLTFFLVLQSCHSSSLGRLFIPDSKGTLWYKTLRFSRKLGMELIFQFLKRFVNVFTLYECIRDMGNTFLLRMIAILAYSSIFVWGSLPS